MKHWLISVGLLLTIMISPACKANPQDGDHLPQGQAPISIAQRHASVLTLPSDSSDQALDDNGGETQSSTSTNPSEGLTQVTASPTGTEAGSEIPLATTTATLTPISTSLPTQTITASTTPSSTDAINSAPSATAQSNAEGTSTSSLCEPAGNSTFEAEVIRLINQERTSEGLPILSSQSQLTSAARSHSADMACNQFFSHTSPTSGTPFDRAAAAGYSYSWLGENIAGGYPSPEEVVSAWMGSSGHRENILSANFTQIGIGFASWGESAYEFYWTAVFGTP